jgi:3-oxoacyl-[acyl-carrier-protein] synthase-1
MPIPTLAVTALASNTSLGDVVTACAAVRAGLSRPGELDQLAFEDESGPVPIMGHPVVTVSGFQGESRLVSLAFPALRALLADRPIASGERACFFVASPDLPARATLAGAPAPRESRFLERLVAMSGLAVPPNLRRDFPLGPTGFVSAIQSAIQAVSQREADVCVVGGVDSLCDDLALAALAAGGRIKTADNPVGLQPGEAAAFILLEGVDGARRRKAEISAVIKGIGEARETRSGNDPTVGEGLTQAIRVLAAASGPLEAPGTFFVVDCNGEPARASDWSWCQQRLLAEMPGVFPAPEWYPAISYGDTGAAGAALGTQLAVRAFARGFAPGRCAVILSSGNEGARSAIALEKAA